MVSRPCLWPLWVVAVHRLLGTILSLASPPLQVFFLYRLAVNLTLKYSSQ